MWPKVRMILKFCAFLHFWSVALWVFVGHGFQPCWYTSRPVGRLRLHLWDLQRGPCCRSTRVISTSNCGLIGGPWWAMAGHGGIWIGLRQSSFFGRASVDDGCCLQADSVLWPICGILTSWYLSTLQYRVRTQLEWFGIAQHACWERKRTRLRFLSVVDASPSQTLAFSISTLPETSRRSRNDLPFSIFQSKVFVQQSLAKRTFHCVWAVCPATAGWIECPVRPRGVNVICKLMKRTNPSMSWNECGYIWYNIL